MVARILVVRHGQSTWNAERRWQGDEDPPLSTLGVRQAQQAAHHVGTFDIVAASSLERAAVTAAIIADRLGIGPILTDPDLRERHAAGFQGLTRDEIEERYPGYLADDRRPEGYETEESVVERAVGALARLASQVGREGTALVVSHGGVIHSLERTAGARRDGRLPNLGGRWFDIGTDTFRAGDAVLLVDEDSITIPRQL